MTCPASQDYWCLMNIQYCVITGKEFKKYTIPHCYGLIICVLPAFLFNPLFLCVSTCTSSCYGPILKQGWPSSLNLPGRMET